MMKLDFQMNIVPILNDFLYLKEISYCMRHVHLSDAGLTLFHDRYSMTEGGVQHGEICKGRDGGHRIRG